MHDHANNFALLLLLLPCGVSAFRVAGGDKGRDEELFVPSVAAMRAVGRRAIHARPLGRVPELVRTEPFAQTSRRFQVRAAGPQMFTSLDGLLAEHHLERLDEVSSVPSNDRQLQRQPGKLILIRHGQSAWNDENRFTGWANVPLTGRGREEAKTAAKRLLRLEDLQIDACYTSVQSRTIETANIFLEQWEKAGRRRPEMFARWRLNERHYGMLTGLNKREALGMFSPSDLQLWRASFEGKPPPMEPDHRHYSRTPKRYERLLAARTQRTNEPNMTVLSLSDVPLTESLADTRTRVASLWNSELKPMVMSGKNVLIVGHANCLRGLISHIQGNLNDRNLPSLGLPNALPLMYEFDEEGAPVSNKPGRCYIRPLDAHWLGEECVRFNELDADGDGGLNASEFDNSEFCRVAWDQYSDSSDSDSCGDGFMLEADNNRDGRVDFNEYMNWWNKLSSDVIDPYA